MVNVTRRLTRRIRGSDGKFYQLVSYDGITWAMDAQRLRRRIEATDNFVSRRIEEIRGKLRFGLASKDRAKLSNELAKLLKNPMLQKNVDANFSGITGIDLPENKKPPKRYAEPVLKHGSPILGRAVGKKGGSSADPYYKRISRKNLRTKKEPNVLIAKPVHYHRCDGHRFVCSCDFKWKKRMCGGTKCLRKLRKEN